MLINGACEKQLKIQLLYKAWLWCSILSKRRHVRLGVKALDIEVENTTFVKSMAVA